MLGTELLGGPGGEVVGEGLEVPLIDVPGYLGEEVYADFAGLEVADVEDPEFFHAVVIGLGHFLPDEGGGRGVEPDVREGRAEVGDVVVNAEAAGAGGDFRGGGEVADVAEIIIGKDDGDIGRDGEAAEVVGEDFLVGAEDLGDFGGVGVDVFGDEGALDGKDFLEGGDNLGGAFRAHHGVVVNAADADGVEVFILAVRLHAFLPVFGHAIGVGDEVELVGGGLPFADVVAEHGLAVGGAHDDGVVVGDDAVFGDGVEGGGAGVHGGPESVGFEAEEEFENFGVGFGADVADLGLEGFGGPGDQAPVLVVDEDATVLDGRRPEVAGAGGDVEVVAMRGGNVGPPIPGGDADGLGEFKDPVGSAAAVAAGDDEVGAARGMGVGDGGDEETFPLSLDFGDVELAGGDEVVYRFAVAEGADEDGWAGERGGAGRDGGFLAGDALDVVRKIASSDLDDLEIVG